MLCCSQVPRRQIEEFASEILDMTPLPEAVASSLDPKESQLAAGACASAVAELRGGAGPHARPRLHLYEQRPCSAEEAASMALLARQQGHAQGSHDPTKVKVVFRDGDGLSGEQEAEL